MPDDYGYFGKGTAGYVQYMQAFERNNGGKKPPSGKGGCLTSMLVSLLIIASLWILLV